MRKLHYHIFFINNIFWTGRSGQYRLNWFKIRDQVLGEKFMKVTINTGNPTLERSCLNFDLTAESTENLIPNFKPI
jgi:hypothetical protein